MGTEGRCTQPVERRGCQSQTVTAPASSGGETNVTITRC